jgi:hypothetical protein
MSRSVEVVVDSPASVEQVHAAFAREDYWLARCAEFDAATTLDSFVVDADGTVTVDTTQHLSCRVLPGFVAKAVPGDLKMLHSETWWPAGDHDVRGQVRVSAPGALGTGHADTRLVASGDGSQLRFDATVQVKIPMLGGRIEGYVGRQLAANITVIQRFTTAWISDHADL